MEGSVYTCTEEGGKASAGRGADDGLERRWEWHGHACGDLGVASSADGDGGSGRQGTVDAELGGRGKGFWSCDRR